jgi:Xaa-Pro aminopeptidase
MNQALFIKNRRDFLARMEDRSFALLFSGEAPHKTADQYYPYVPNRNFYYLTGLTRPHFVLALLKADGVTREFLFIEEATDYSEKWLGHRLTREEASASSGIPVSQIQYTQQLEAFVASAVLSNSRKALMSVPRFLYLDLHRPQPRFKPLAWTQAAFVVENYPEIGVKNAGEILDSLRMIKDPWEVSQIEKAIGYAKVGIEAVWKAARPGMNEHTLDALFEYASRTAGSEGLSFGTILASGINATALHYEENNCVIEAGALVLTDLGCLAGPYASDITRTFPVSGKFTPRQRELYQLVLDVNKACIGFVKPGIFWADLNAFAKKRLAEGAVRLGLIHEEAEIDRYYYHTVSHYLGLDVHDVGSYQDPLREGMVLTIEPGLYVAEEKIGIRIEDNILITHDGARNLSADILKEPDDIEAFLSR